LGFQGLATGDQSGFQEKQLCEHQSEHASSRGEDWIWLKRQTLSCLTITYGGAIWRELAPTTRRRLA
jgi:hypothetical protein